MISQQLAFMLKTVAMALGDDLRREVVFVGGCTTALFITDQFVLEKVRATQDVDLICQLSGKPGWPHLQTTLQERGFSISPEDEFVCRMRLGQLIVDFMPDDPAILGFTNRWYSRGIETARVHTLQEGLEIRVLTPALFVATKLEAWKGRGEGDLLTSRDAEDLGQIVDGRQELLNEMKAAPEDIRVYIAEETRALMRTPHFEDFVDGTVLGPTGRSDIVFDRFVALSRLDDAS